MQAQEYIPQNSLIKTVNIEGQQVAVFSDPSRISEVTTRLCQLISQLCKTVPMGDGIGLFVEIQENMKLVNNTLGYQRWLQDSQRRNSAVEDLKNEDLMED